MEQMQNNIVHINMMEAKALNSGASGVDAIDFDVTEYKNNVEVIKKEDRQRMTIHEVNMPDGSLNFIGATLTLPIDTPEDTIEVTTEMVAVSIAAFQHMENKMFAAREKLPCFRALGQNGTTLQEDDVWALYDCMNNFFGPEIPDMLRLTAFPDKERVIPELSDKDGKSFVEFIKENIQPHDIGNWPRIFGVICQTLSDEDNLFIA